MKKIKNILILAAGDSTRFWPLTGKSFFSFLGKPLLFHLIDNLKKIAENIVIVANQAEKPLLDRLKFEKLKIVLQKKELSGQAGAIISAREKIKGEVLILNAGDIFNYNFLNQYINLLRQKRFECLLTGKKVLEYFPGGYFQFKQGELKGISEKPAKDKVPSDIVRLVVDYFSNSENLCNILLNLKVNKDDWYEQGINEYLRKTNKASYILYDDYWYSLKYPWHVLPMMHYFLRRLKKEEVKLGKNVKIATTAKIVGPCFIDDNSVIGDFVLLRQSHIGKNSLIGGFCEITRSYIGNNVLLHRNYIGDSIIDNNVMFGAEATTANFRFDEKNIKSVIRGDKIDTGLTKLGAIVGSNAKIGVNTTLLPGVKIGRYTFVSPCYTIFEDIEDEMFIFKKKRVKNIYKV